MVKEIEKKKEALKLKKSRLEAQERLLKLKERKSRTRLLIEIGGLAEKAGISKLNTNTLLGAFLEIKERKNKEQTIKKWTEKGAEAFDLEMKKNGRAIILSFPTEPDKETKTKVRDLGLRWNRFRKEWQGYANQVALQEVLKGREHTLEVLEE